ncbi:oligosaccharide flippase family protein [Thalassotalea aquiviva]|uniref:oligosaccharide flippase family protein n=1 Tax=Thalassotalea aquiviva TaxID=3242415 RepID=UPI00352B82A9
MSESVNLKHQVLHSLKWVTACKITSQVYSWLITFWVIRLLMPEDYGIVVMADIFFSFLLLTAGSFFGPIIIQKQTIEREEMRKLFGMIVCVYSGLFLLQFFLASSIARYFNSEQVGFVLKATAICFLFNMFMLIPSALLNKKMAFKAISLITAFANITSASLTLFLAYQGYGFWSIIIGQIIGAGLKAFLVNVINPYWVMPSFNWSGTKDLLKFGGLIGIHALLIHAFSYLDITIAGRVLSAAEIGFFAIATQLALMPLKKLLPLIRKVAFPAFSKIQQQPKLIANYILKAQKISLLITFPVFWGISVTCDYIIPIFLGEKWIPAILPTTLLLLIMPLRFSEELFFPAFRGMGKVEHLIKNISLLILAMFIGLIIGIQFGVIGIIGVWITVYPLMYLILLLRNAHQLSRNIIDFLRPFKEPFFASLAMYILVSGVKLQLPEITLLNLCILIFVGTLTYIFTVHVFNKTIVNEFKAIIKQS